jgi:sugar lactone lactonase YvrE
MRVLRGVFPVVLILGGALASDAQTRYRFTDPIAVPAASAVSDSALFYPSGVVVDAAGVIWIADTVHHVIRVLDRDGTTRIVAGEAGVPGAADGPAREARFRYPQGMAADTSGNIYIADSGNGTIRVLTRAGRVETFAGAAGDLGTDNGDRLLRARFIVPIDVAWDITGTLYVSDHSSHTIRAISSDRNVTTIAGVAGTVGSGDGFRDRARFHAPAGIALDPAGNLWIADSGSHTIRMMTGDGFVTTIAGVPGSTGFADGALTEAKFSQPRGIALGADGSIFVSDTKNHTIRRILGDSVETVAGTAGIAGYANGAGEAVRFDNPIAIAVGADGTLWVADMMNHTIRSGNEDGFGNGRRRAVRR